MPHTRIDDSFKSELLGTGSPSFVLPSSARRLSGFASLKKESTYGHTISRVCKVIQYIDILHDSYLEQDVAPWLDRSFMVRKVVGSRGGGEAGGGGPIELYLVPASAPRLV